MVRLLPRGICAFARNWRAVEIMTSRDILELPWLMSPKEALRSAFAQDRMIIEANRKEKIWIIQDKWHPP
jgi:hypothetical protein